MQRKEIEFTLLQARSAIDQAWADMRVRRSELESIIDKRLCDKSEPILIELAFSAVKLELRIRYLQTLLDGL